MKRSLWVSFALHLAIFLVVWLGLPHFLPPLPSPTVIVPVEVADIGEITNTKVKQEKEPEPQPPPPPPQQPPKQDETPPPPPKAEQPPPPPPEKKPEPLPEKKPEPLPEKKPEPKKPEKKPEPKPDPLASVLKNIAQLKPSTPSKTPPDPKQKEASAPQNNTPSLSDRVTISEADALRRQIASCWNMPIGARNAEQLIVEVVIEVNPDRTVQSVQIVDMVRLADPFFRAAAESAVRALRNPRCSPLELPPDKYQEWKTIHFNFDPRDML
ncbi:MAG: cell envelope integrity protein TolA [Alphaproteobacteria bacterium]